MKRANIKAFNNYYERFVIIENLIDLYDFFEEKTKGLIKESAKTLVERAQKVAKGEVSNITHLGQTDCITIGTETMSSIYGQGIIYSQAKLMGTYQRDLERYVNDGKILAINPYNMVSYFTLPKDAEYEIISEKENYTHDDIRIIKFEGGTHWYAKISNIDVVIDDEQKWNAQWIARQKAEQFLKQLYNG